ncbi:uncharacterized protein LOC131950320 [Physella acuta]|uniref:uncharacterized protein LOC131950320 n=1 Tax=Physella acuta TaxID=109671 RepID=UPI0027DC8458|nr:uncharacterized protein LOC131950320 [Physella acuta]
MSEEFSMLGELQNTSYKDEARDETVVKHDQVIIVVPSLVLDFFLTFNLLICGNIIALFGIVGNIINIIVFKKQGYEDSVNITLTALAITPKLDTAVSNKEKKVVLMLIVVSVIFIVCLIPQSSTLTAVGQVSSLMVGGMNFDLAMVCYSISYLMETVSSSVNIIVYYKMSSSITQQRYHNITSTAMSVNVTLQTQFGASLYVSPVALEFFLTFNLLICGNIIGVLGISGNIINIIVFYKQGYEDSVNITLTALALNARAEWINSVSRKEIKKDNIVSNKEKRVVLMLIVVSVIFIVCLIPQSAILTALIQVPDLSAGGRYFDLAMVCYSISYLMEAVCSSVNILVYYKMSSKYRNTISEHFLQCYS